MNKVIKISYNNIILKITIFKVFNNIKIFSLMIFNIKKNFLLLTSFYNK
jgi:hypothetical protein